MTSAFDIVRCAAWQRDRKMTSLIGCNISPFRASGPRLRPGCNSGPMFRFVIAFSHYILHIYGTWEKAGSNITLPSLLLVLVISKLAVTFPSRELVSIMRGYQLNELVKGPDDLKLQDLPDPTPEEHEYLIEIHAAATNFFDLLQIRGKYQHQPPLPWIAGAEFSGIVKKIPKKLPYGKTNRFAVGDRVFGSALGAYASHICAPEKVLHPIPKDWSFFDAAGLFVTAPTSYAGLVTRAGIKRGDWVLVHAAAGGVGLAAVQIAKAFGATVVATAGTEHKRQVARSFGADYAIDYKEEDWPQKVKELTPEGRGVDIVYDSVGMIRQSMKCVAWNGRLLVIGFAGGDIEKIATNLILLKNISVIGLHWGAYSYNEPEKQPEVWEGIFDLIDSGKFRGTCYTDVEYVGLEKIPEALKALGGRETWGKVVVKIPQDGQSKL